MSIDHHKPCAYHVESNLGRKHLCKNEMSMFQNNYHKIELELYWSVDDHIKWIGFILFVEKVEHETKRN